MDSDTHHRARWEKRYQDGKTAWDRGQPSPALVAALAAMPQPPARVLVPACGQGHEVIYLADQGYQVTGVDFAPSAVSALKKALSDENLRAEILEQDLFSWDPGEPFDIIYEQTAICALEPALWARYAERLHAWTKPGGVIIGLFMQTHRDGGPPWHVPLDRLAELFPESDWLWPSGPLTTVSHPSGLEEAFITLQRHD